MSSPWLTIVTVMDGLLKRYCTADLVPYPLDSIAQVSISPCLSTTVRPFGTTGSIAQVSIWPYTCWNLREGMSSPRLTAPLPPAELSVWPYKACLALNNPC